MARKDIHRPSAIEPSDYEFVAHDYYGPDSQYMDLSSERKYFRDHMARSGGKFSNHDHAGSCHVCGAGAMYVAKFWHKASNVYIVTGEDCAAKMEMGDPAAFRSFRDKVGKGREAAAGKRKAKASLEAAGLGAAWELHEARGKANDLSRDESIVLEMVWKLIKYGSISDKQQGFLKLLLERIEKAPALAAKRAAEKAAAAPVPQQESRWLVEGEVVSIKEQEGQFGFQIKMLVKHADGWKLWGTVPSAISHGLSKGDSVQFVAAVQRSNEDASFGFFSRPAQAKVLNKAVAA